MSKFLFEASYTTDGIKGVQGAGGSSRRDAVAQVAESVGGKLEAFYFAFGEQDAYVVVELPDNESAAAVALTVNASGAVTVKTVVLLTPEEVDDAAKRSVDTSRPDPDSGLATAPLTSSGRRRRRIRRALLVPRRRRPGVARRLQPRRSRHAPVCRRDDPSLAARGLRVAGVAGAGQHHAGAVAAEDVGPGRPLELRRDPANEHDPDAIAVLSGGRWRAGGLGSAGAGRRAGAGSRRRPAVDGGRAARAAPLTARRAAWAHHAPGARRGRRAAHSGRPA